MVHIVYNVLFCFIRIRSVTAQFMLQLRCRLPFLGALGSISLTFYAQLFCTKVLRTAFLYMHLRFVRFGWNIIGAKAAREMLVKLIPCVKR